jgi:peptidoglycan-N-acetylglucosamine deacetylase
VWPYLHDGEPAVAEIPAHWGLDDGPHFLFSTNPPNYRQIFPPIAVLSSWRAEFDGIRRLGGVMTLILHPQLIARPSRLDMLQQLIDHVRSEKGAWITAAGEVADVTRSVLVGPAGGRSSER